MILFCPVKFPDNLSQRQTYNRNRQNVLTRFMPDVLMYF